MNKEVFFGPALIRKAISISAVVLLIIVLAVFFSNNIGSIYVNDGSSMKETIEDGDVLLINRLSYIWKSPKRFDLVYFEKDSVYEGVKRIVGLPGENIKIKDGNIYVDGNILEQSIWERVFGLGIEDIDVTLSDNEYFVLGDNLSFSEDSRSKEIGPVAIDEIKGVPWFCCYPFTNFGWVR